MPQKRLIVDMDGTIARFHDEVDYLERMFEQNFFDTLRPFEKMVEGIRLFIQQYPETPVYTCSSVVQSQYCIAEKSAWLDRHLPEIPKERRIFAEAGRSKADYIPNGVTKNDFLLDDYNRGLHMFRYGGGSAIKCHNNINQKGRGAHGGEQGYMWEGPMVHIEDAPPLIAAELAQLMGLEYSLEQAAQACQVQYIHSISIPGNGNPLYPKRLICLQTGDETIYAALDRSQGSWTEYFQNPFNALRYLSGDPLAREYKLRTYDRTELHASGYQLEAVCQNAYGNNDFRAYLRADRGQLANDTMLSRSHREDAVVGFVCQLSPDNARFCLTPYYDHKSMEDRMAMHTRNKEPYYVEYFVDSEERKKTHRSLDRTLNDAMRRAHEGQTAASPERSQDK